MAGIRPSDLVVTGACALVVAPGAAITPERWAGAPARLSRMDRLCALTLVACDGALRDAGLAPTAQEWNGERTAIVLGTAYGCHATNEDYYRGLVREGPAGASPRLFAYTLPSSPVGEVSIHYGIRGPATALSNGLTSGIDALSDGIAQLRQGRADRVLVCAVDVATPLLSRLLASAGDVEPLFAAAALVDGAAALLLERAADAAARGATPRGRVLGCAAAFHAGARAAAVSTAIAQALAEADVAAAAVRRLLAAPADAAVARARGIVAAAADSDGGADERAGTRASERIDIRAHEAARPLAAEETGAREAPRSLPAEEMEARVRESARSLATEATGARSHDPTRSLAAEETGRRARESARSLATEATGARAAEPPAARAHERAGSSAASSDVAADNAAVAADNAAVAADNAAVAADNAVDGASDDAAGALGAASLIRLARTLRGAGGAEELTLLCAGDDAGAGAAAVIASS